MRITYPPVPTVFGISPHGILTAIGILVGAYLLLREIRRRDLDRQVVENAVIWAVFAGIVGARLDYVLFHLDHFESIWQVFQVWNGGLALFGGLIAGTLAGIVVLRRGGAHVPRVLDATVPYVALAIGIGRLGDVLLTDHLGKPMDGWFGLGYVVKAGYDLAPGFGTDSAQPPGPGQACADVGQYYAGCAYHLTPVYDMLGALALAALLLLLRRGVAYRSGVAMCVFGAWYGTQRLVLDFARGVDEQPLLGLTTTQLMSVVVIVASLATLVAIRTRGRGLGDRPGDPPSSRASLRRVPAGEEQAAVPD